MVGVVVTEINEEEPEMEMDIPVLDQKLVENLEKMAKVGNNESILELANAYKEAEEYEKAYYWYLEAVHADIDSEFTAEALSNLGWMYLLGKHVRQDYLKAFQLFTQSMEMGGVEGVYHLFYLHEMGIYDEKDIALANLVYKSDLCAWKHANDRRTNNAQELSR